jgi:phytoene synthase
MNALVPARDGRDACLTLLSQHSKSFALAGRLLTPDARRDAAALYTWCRYADDLIDLSTSERQPVLIRRLERELYSVYAGEAQSALALRALQEVALACDIPYQYPHELLLGMRMDATGTRYATVDTLLLYCHRVAGVVGLMMCHVLGVSDERALRHAAHLGIGMQLTNVCRDVHEDWQRGRLYLPDELLRECGAPELGARLGGELPKAAHPALGRAVEHLLKIAGTFYASGDRGLAALDARSALAVRTARLVYSQIGSEIARRRYDVSRGRAVVPSWKKLFLALEAALTTFGSPRQDTRLRALPVKRYPDDVLPV